MKTRSFEESINPQVNKYVKSLLKEFERRRIIRDNFGIYIVSSDDQDIETHVTPTKNNLNGEVAQRLKELQDILTSAYLYINYTDSENAGKMTLTQIIGAFENKRVLSAPWKNKEDIIAIFDKIESWQLDHEMWAEADSVIEKYDIKLDLITAQVLEFFGRKVTKDYFEKLSYESETSINNKGSDLVLSNIQENQAKLLLFDFKFRKNLQNLTSDFIVQGLEYLKEHVEERLLKKSYFFQVYFTTEPTSTFHKTNFKIMQLLEKVEIPSNYKERMKVLLVSTHHLNLLEDEYKKFKEKKIQKDIPFIFSSQQPPAKHPEYNDHFYDEVFDLKENDIEVQLTPMSTPTWRFGFRLSGQRNARILPPRHNGTLDIHIGVGDIVANKQWINENILYLTRYLQVNPGTNQLTNEYKGGPVSMKISAIDDKTVEVTVSEDGYELIKNRYKVMQGFMFCKLSAWRDFTNFTLSANIKVLHKER